MYFIKSGKVASILPAFNDFKFLKIKEGYYFGELDLLFYNEIRKYTFMAAKESELLVLSKKNFKNIFLIDFRDIGMDFINNAYLRKKRTRAVWKEANSFCKAHINETFIRKNGSKEKLENEANEKNNFKILTDSVLTTPFQEHGFIVNVLNLNILL